MHSLSNSILKRWHTLTASPRAKQRLWGGVYWREDDQGVRHISCRQCPKFDAGREVCGVYFGTQIRKCVVASIEAHLNDCRDKEVLEIGYGRFALAKTLVRRSGGRWSGIDPLQPESKAAKLGHGGYGHAAEIPFPDNTFDLVCGVQTFAHWGQKKNVALGVTSEYSACMEELVRVLKPGGEVYFETPLHLHGHEMFIMADLDRIRALFPAAQWKNLVFEKWRYNHEPLEPYVRAPDIFTEWEVQISSYSDEEVERAKNEPVHQLTITAETAN